MTPKRHRATGWEPRWWLTVPDGLRDGLARALGVTAIDIRRIRQVYDWDIWQVQLWNWRLLEVAGEQLARHMTRTPIRFKTTIQVFVSRSPSDGVESGESER